MPAVCVERTYPPSLSNYGALRSVTKADLLVCVSELVLHHDTVKPPEAHMDILDGAAIFNMIKPRTPVSFGGYIKQVMEYVRKQFRGDMQRVDMVLDAYLEDSLKAATRRKRGKGIRRHVEGNNQVTSKSVCVYTRTSRGSFISSVIGLWMKNSQDL